MLAGFVAGYLGSGGDLSHALRLGTASGAATAFSEGMATRDAIEAILKSLPAPKKR
jgi:1-phosphofructokinase